MDYMHDLKEKLCDELEEIARKPEMSAGDLEAIHKLTDTIKNIDKIEMLEDGDGYSMDGDWEARGSYRGGDYSRRDYDDGSSNANRGMHYVRGHYSRARRDSMGRYSRDGAKDKMMHHLEEMMNSAGTEKEREMVRRFMSQMENA